MARTSSQTTRARLKGRGLAMVLATGALAAAAIGTSVLQARPASAKSLPLSVVTTSSANPNTYGSSVTFTTTVTGSAATPTGRMTYLAKVGKTTSTICSQVAVSGVGTVSTSTCAYDPTLLTPVGQSAKIYAKYSGDKNYNTEQSAVLTQVELGSDTLASFVVSTSAADITTGTSVTFGTTLEGEDGVPAGSVEFTDNTSPITCTGMSTPWVILAGGTATCQDVPAIGAHTISAVYSGNVTYAGASAPASISESVSGTLPDAPIIGSATAGPGSATVNFSPPDAGDGPPVTGYTITAIDSTTPANGGQTATGASSPITVSGLTNGDSYTFTVTATNSAGTGAASEPSDAVVPDLGDQDWPSFRSDVTHDGVDPESDIGSGDVSSLTAGWTAATGVPIDGTPAVVLDPITGVDILYVGDTNGTMYAYNAATGAQLWTFSTPLTQGSALHNGTDKRPPPASNAIFDSPTVYDGVLYFADQGGELFAVNASAGSLICSVELHHTIEASPTVVADPDGSGPVVYIGSYGYKAEWAVYGAANTHNQCTVDWQNTTDLAPSGTFSTAGYATDANGENLVIFGQVNRRPATADNYVLALDAATGAEVWDSQLSDVHEVGSSPLISAPGVNGIADGAVYIEELDRRVFAMDLTTGAPMWNYTIASQTQGETYSSAALVGNMVVIGSNVGVFGLNAVTGAMEWHALANVDVASSPAVSGADGDQIAFVSGLGGGIYALDPATGAELWSSATTNGFYASPVISRGRLFDADLGGIIYQYGAP